LLARIALAVVCVHVFAPLGVLAQSTNARITGIVTDPSKTIIRHALVTAVNSDTGVQFPTTTNDSGVYALPELPPGDYRIEVANRNFKSIVEPGITLHVQDVLEINFEMAAGSMSESVTLDQSDNGINTTDSCRRSLEVSGPRPLEMSCSRDGPDQNERTGSQAH
jgi:hypothetical protein